MDFGSTPCGVFNTMDHTRHLLFNLDPITLFFRKGNKRTSTLSAHCIQNGYTIIGVRSLGRQFGSVTRPTGPKPNAGNLHCLNIRVVHREASLYRVNKSARDKFLTNVRVHELSAVFMIHVNYWPFRLLGTVCKHLNLTRVLSYF